VEIRTGEYVAIMGPSGIGKVHAMNLIGVLSGITERREVRALLRGRLVSDRMRIELAYIRNKGSLRISDLTPALCRGPRTLHHVECR